MCQQATDADAATGAEDVLAIRVAGELHVGPFGEQIVEERSQVRSGNLYHFLDK